MGDGVHVSQQPLDHPCVEFDRIRQQRLVPGRLTMPEPQKTLRRTNDCFAQLVPVEATDKVEGLVDRVGKFEVTRAIAEVLATHGQYHVAAWVGVEEMVDDTLNHQACVLVVGIGAVKELLELVDHEKQAQVAYVRTRRREQFV
nr:hypothetical protein [Candidatus Accumulibacter sp. ACC007]